MDRSSDGTAMRQDLMRVRSFPKPCDAAAAMRHGAEFRRRNVGTMQSGYNPQPLMATGDQRVAGGADGSGKGELATVFLAGFGFFCVTPFRGALGGGPAGLSSATTGLGSKLFEAGGGTLGGGKAHHTRE